MEEQMVELISSLQQAIEGIAPTAWNALVVAAFAKSIAVFPFAIAVLFVDYKLMKNHKKILDFTEANDLEIPAFALFLVFLLINVVSVGDLFFYTTWIGLFDPESRAVLDLIKLASS